MFGSNNFSAIVFITALYLLQLWQHEVEAEDKCNLQSNKTCDDCIEHGCTYCASTKTCMSFDLVKDTLNNTCEGQDWEYKQCIVTGKFLLIAVPVACVVVIVALGCCIYCCCGCETCCRCCRGCMDCICTICYYCFCCCCCCDRASRSSGESHGLLMGVRNPMTQAAAARIQSATAKSFGGWVPKGSFASRAQSTADRRAYWGIY